MKIVKGQIVEVHGKPATVIDVTKSLVLVEMDTMNGTVRKGVPKGSVQ